jgi:hypothetical protein
MRSVVRLAVIVVGAAALLYLLYQRFDERWQFEGRGRAHAIAFAGSDLKVVADQFWWVYEGDQKDPVGIKENRHCALSGAELYDALGRGQRFEWSLARNRGWDTQGAVTDPWKRPIHAILRATGDSFRLRLWSDGPNGLNEMGGGDDILLVQEIKIP